MLEKWNNPRIGAYILYIITQHSIIFIVSRLIQQTSHNGTTLLEQESSRRHSIPRLIDLSVNFLFSIYQFARVYQRARARAREREREEMSFCRDSIDLVPEIQLLCSRQRWRTLFFSAGKELHFINCTRRSQPNVCCWNQFDEAKWNRAKRRQYSDFESRTMELCLYKKINLTFNHEKAQFSLLFLVDGPATLHLLACFFVLLAQVRWFRIATCSTDFI